MFLHLTGRGAPNLPIFSVRTGGTEQEGSCQLHHMRLGSWRKHRDKGFARGFLVLPESSLGMGCLAGCLATTSFIMGILLQKCQPEESGQSF